ncbi:MAG: hypothetical protein P4L31_00160, partial [Candidatus Babeliales bacterium]|nr:hypothetical protein [Candidatus Babeliales bacterium]
SFNDELHYNCGDEERLLAQQIIVRNPAGTKLRELENALRNTPSLLWVHDEHEVRQICARRTQLQGAIAHIKTEWTKHHKLTAFGTIPEYIHGPNGFKLASAPTTQSDNAQPQAHQEQHSAQSTSSIAAQAHTLPSGRSATKPDEMD